MNNSNPIEFGVEVLMHHTALRVVEAALTTTHGPDYARIFLEDHCIAIDRAVRQWRRGRSEAQVASDLHALNRLLLRS